MSQRYAEDARVDGDGPPVGTADTLRGELDRADLPRHLACFYRSPQTQRTVAGTFVRHALQTGKRCLYFLDTNSRSTVERLLRSMDVDVDDRLAAGDLVIRSASDAYDEADFDPEALISLLGDACRASVDDGYDGLWTAGELSWCFHTDLSYDHVVDFEAAFDAACPDLPVTALCQYDLNQFNDESVAKALWTHEQVIYRYTLCENPYYVSPDEYRTQEARPLNARLMLEQMHGLTHARNQLERHEQRLSVVNRILRHNIRNDLNVVSGILSALDAEQPADARRLETAREHVDDIVDIADKARYVERTIGESRMERTALAPVVARAIERVEETFPDADVSVTGEEDVSVAVDTNLDTALAELLEYAIRMQDTDQPTLTLTVTDRPPEQVRLDIDYPGPPIPPNDRRVLASGTETQLQHCRGLELWLAKWILENAHGHLTFPESGASQIRVELYRRMD
ncbi:MEDS domain-containing protein [Haloplanus sp. C73]|uniref:MEDS domain-containing protein n=1 Tax=Haloplanus sp. C73 TaxID=3421641 RepID=UPI003EB9C66B